MLHTPHPLPCIPTGPVVLAFRESNRQSTSSTWLHWGQSCQAPRGSCIGEAPAVQWSFDRVAVPWILPESYRNPKGAALDFPGDDNQAEGDNDKGSGTAPDGAPAEGEDDEDGDDDEGFETVEDEEEDTGSKVVVKIPLKDLDKPEGSGVTGADRLFDSDDEEVDAGPEGANRNGLSNGRHHR